MSGWIAAVVALLLHEAGHLTAAVCLGIPLRRLHLEPGGAAMTFDFSHAGYLAEAIVHASGPLFGIAAALLFCRMSPYLSGLSLTLSLVNLLPIRGLDGGGLLTSLLSLRFLPDTVWRITEAASGAALLVLWAAILWIELRVGPDLALLAFVLALFFR